MLANTARDAEQYEDASELKPATARSLRGIEIHQRSLALIPKDTAIFEIRYSTENGAGTSKAIAIFDNRTVLVLGFLAFP